MPLGAVQNKAFQVQLAGMQRMGPRIRLHSTLSTGCVGDDDIKLDYEVRAHTGHDVIMMSSQR